MTETVQKKFDYLPWLITMAALLIRMVYLTQIEADNPYFHDETLVAEVHHEWAKDIVAGRTDGEGEAFIRAPLYPYIMAGIYRILGSNTLYPRLIQLLIGSFLTLGIYSVAKNIFGRKEAIASAVIWAIYGPMIFFEGELFETSLTAGLIFIAFIFWDKGTKDLKIRYFLGAGLLIGLAVIMKPNSAIFLPLLLLWYFFYKQTKSAGWKPVVMFLAGGLIVIAPVTIRNLAVSGEFVPVAAYGGLNLYLGANENSDGVSAILPGEIETEADNQWGKAHHATALTAMSIRVASERSGQELTPAEASAYWQKEAAGYALKNPLGFLWLNVKKTLLFFQGFEFGNTRDLYFSRQHSSLLSVLLLKKGIMFPLGLLIPFAGLGLYFVFRDKVVGRGNLTAFLLGAVLSTTLVFVCARFRMNAIPFLIVLGGAGIVRIFRELSGKKVLFHLILFLPLLFLANVNLFGLHRDTAFQEYFNIGQTYLEKGDFQKGYDSLIKSIQAKPDFIPALNELGVFLEAIGKYPQAVYYYRMIWELTPDDAVALYNLGAAEGKGGAIDSAAVHLQRAVEIDPGFWQAWLNLGNTMLYKNDFDAAEDCYLTTAQLTPDNPDVMFNLGNFYIMSDKKDEARQYLEKVQALNPEYPSLEKILERLEAEGK